MRIDILVAFKISIFTIYHFVFILVINKGYRKLITPYFDDYPQLQFQQVPPIQLPARIINSPDSLYPRKIIQMLGYNKCL